MIGLDANVLLRYLLQDDPVQCAKVNQFVTRKLSAQRPGYVSLVAVVETAWVMLRRYRMSPVTFADGLLILMLSEGFLFQESQCVFEALVALKDGRLDFADALVASLGDKSGCSTTVTFDKRAARDPRFTLL